MAQDPYRYFRLEARELLDQFGEAILELEKGVGDDQVQRLLRLAHTLKGAARVVKQPEIADRAHAIEDALSPFRGSVAPIPRQPIDTVVRHLDDIGGRVRALSPGEPALPAPADRPAPEETVRTVRADISEMDALLDGIVEATALLGGLRTATQSLEQAQRLADVLVDQLARPGAAESGRRVAAANGTLSIAEELRGSFGGIERRVGSAIEQIDRELRQLRDAAEQLRLVSSAELFTPLERTAHDAGRALGKHVAFLGRGGGVRLDAHLFSAVQGALVQIVRNAVAHGIEPEAERRAAGKEATGQVSLDVFRRGKQIVFECRDDGRGIDLAAVRRVALQRGVAPEVVNGPGTQGLATLLLRGGISTSDAVTEVSGRGVGLDVVRDAIERLGGTVAVETEPGNGTSFRLAVPVTVMSLEALNVEAAGTIASIPLAAVRGTMRVVADAVTRTSSGATMLYEDGAIPFVWLGNALYGSRPVPGRTCSAVAVSAGAGTIAVGIDRLLGTATIVMRPLPDLAPASPIVSGTTLDAQGNPQLVLDPDGLFAAAQAAGAAVSEPAKRSAPVLVIDDSLTTRMLEQGILESAGYEVDVAVSAEAGLERARLKRYGLFLVDVEMPGMDGFGFVERIRADPALHDIPAVLVTSRNAPEDLQRGRDIGAHGYIVKSEFDQAALLSLIRPLIG